MLTDLCSKSKSLTVLRQIVCFVLSGHDWRITQSCTTSVRHRCGVSLNTVEQSILAVQHAVILASSFSPLKLGTITYEDTFLEFFSSCISLCDKVSFQSPFGILQLHGHIK